MERNLGELSFLLGENSSARAHWEAARDFYEKTGSEQGQGNVESNLGELLFKEGEIELAHQKIQNAFDLYLKTGSKQGQMNCFWTWAEFAEKDDPQKAIEYYNKALAIAKELQAKDKIAFFQEKIDELSKDD